MQSQLFIYILTLLIIGLLLYFGIKWIGGIIKTQEVIDATKFQIDLENSFEKTRPNYGSTLKKDFLAPDGVDRICFVDSFLEIAQRNLKGLCDKTHDDYDPVMCNEWKDNTTAVVFSPVIDRNINLGAVTVDATPKYMCFNTSTTRRFSLLMTGLGNRVKIARS